MSYTLVVAEVRRGVFEERNLDSIGIAALMRKNIVLLMPDGAYEMNGNLVDSIIRTTAQEEIFLNPLNFNTILEKTMNSQGVPDLIVFTHSSSGTELASYAAGHFNMPLITDVSSFDKEKNVFYKSYYSDKIFAEFRQTGSGCCIVTVRSGSFKEHAVEKGPGETSVLDDITLAEGRTFIEYVEEETGEIDITKAEFLLSVGRGIGNKDEIADYQELAGLLKATLSGSRPVIDKLWLPKAQQVGTSGKTVKPKVYLAMGISGAFQHIAGMKDSDCIIAVNKDPEAPIFQYAHYGVVGDANKLRDKLKDIAKG